MLIARPKTSVADPGCLFRIPDPNFTNSGSRISDPKTATKERGGNFFVVVIPLYVATNFTKFKIILVLKCREKFGPIFKEL